MGGVCPCLAGVQKAAEQPKTETKQAPPTVTRKEEETPLLADNKPEAAPAAVAAQELPPPTETVPPAEASNDAAPAAEGGVPPIGVGSFLDIFSNSYQRWCPGVINGIDAQSVFVVYQVPVEQNMINTKTLPLDSPEIRMPVDDGPWLDQLVEVYSHSNQMWLHARILEIKAGVASVAFFYPNMPPDSEPVTKQLALGDPDIRLPGADINVATPVGVGHETLVVGSQVEIYSNSLATWIPGVVQDIRDGLLVVAFFYPDMNMSEPPAVKELPIGHQDVRLPTVPLEVDPNVNLDDYVAGKPIEVFSHSRQVWIMAVIKEVTDGLVTASFRYPDMPADSEIYEKVLPAGSADLRFPDTAEGATA